MTMAATDDEPRGELRDELTRALQRVPELAGRELSFTALSGGITNRNYLVVAAGARDRYVLRLAGNDTHLLGISREVEHAATVAAAGVGVGPEVVAFIRPEGYLVTRFIVGVPVSDDAVHRPETIRRVADSIRRVHDGPAIPGLFMPFRIVEAYRALARERGVPIPAEYELATAITRRIELAFLAAPVELRPCHNDLLNANFIDDGDRIRIVDWEYAGLGDPFFDLGNFSVNHGLSADEDAILLTAYEGAARRPRAARLLLMRIASDFREAMWGVLQQGISTLDVDFVAYAAEHFDRLLANASGASFERALRDAAEGWAESAVDHARALIIGGGVGGTSIAYHLAELGWTDIILVDRAELTSGSTFHSAGLVGQLRSSVTLTRMMMYGTALYRRLTAETGVDVGWHEVGSLRLASTKARYEELQRQAGWAKTFGLPLELISAAEAQDRFPLMSLDGVLGAVWLPTDGWLDPSGLAQALAAGARARGAQIRQHTRVVGVNVERGRVTGVEVEARGGEPSTIAADVVVNAGGMFAPEIGRLAGVTVAIIPMAHQYLFTHAIEGVQPGLPTMRDPDNLCYFREEVGGLCMGGYERNPAPWSLDGVPPDFNHRLLDPDWPRFESIMEGAIRRVPAIADAGVTRMINGPEGFTPDNEFILGESEVRGFFVAAGFCAHGIAGTGGIGQQMARWIVDGEPELDLWKMDIRRFGGQYRSQQLTLARSYENYATYYDIHYPNEERLAARPLRLSPAYDELTALGAVFGEKSMWERPNWFTPNEDGAGVTDRATLEALRPRGWAGEHWSPAIGAEALATRQAAGLFDESSFAKIEVEGTGALAYLQYLCDNDIDRPVGAIVYTQMLNSRGGIECDFTVTRLADDRFLIVTGTAFGNHDLGWIRKHLPDDGQVRVRDVTSARACFGLWGPRARDILAPLTKDDVSDTGFPYLTAREISVADVPVLALRVTYVGELGWELYPPAEYGRALWQALWAAGTAHGLTAAGYRAIDALRLEKGYRVWSSDITPEETPFEAGLGFAARLDKGDFLGQGALVVAKAAGPRKRLRCLVLDDPRSVALGNEPVRVAGAIVGRVTSGGYGFAVERSIAYAYLPPDQAPIGTSGEVDIFGEWVGFEVVREPLWDPEGSRIRS